MLIALKSLKDDAVVTNEEFDEMKKKVLSSKTEISSIKCLKNYKKLLDKQIITDEEFAKIKESIL